MKTILKFLVVISFVIVLSACGGNTNDTQSEDLISVAYTNAAMTLSVQRQNNTPTATLMPFSTTIPTLAVSPTVGVVVTSTARSAATNTPVSTANGCNDAVYVSDVTIPDGTVLAPGESFTKTWKFQNTGTCNWNEGYLITFVSGTNMGGVATTINQDVSVGATGDISVSLTAPNTVGTQAGYWRLADGSGNAFGQTVYVMIAVSGSASTVTPTLTQTGEMTATSEPTLTPSVTATFTPTQIPTETPTP
jgi:uncharacterized protein YceK